MKDREDRKKTLLKRLQEYSVSDYYGFHMPGHKRNENLFGDARAYEIDITEIEGFDDLHHAEGILRETEILAAKVYHAQESHLLVGGSTVGILSAILGCTNRGDTVLVARNCHKSVYHAMELQGLHPIYLYPAYDLKMQIAGPVSAEDVRRELTEHPGIRAVVIVSPTYDGVVSDIGAIAAAAHEAGVPLIVDEAHGAHFGFHPYFPKNANQRGADIVIHSMHKTLPCLTQTALLHINGDLVHGRRVKKHLHMLMTSSPSYVLMASMDACIRLLEERGAAYFEDYVVNLQALRASLKKEHGIRLLEEPGSDPSKILLGTGETGLSGKQLSDMLRQEYHLQPEMAAGNYVLLMTAVGDTKEGFERLREAVGDICLRAEIPGLLSGGQDRIRWKSASSKATLQNDGTQENSDRDVSGTKDLKKDPSKEAVLPHAQILLPPGEAAGLSKEGCEQYPFDDERCVGGMSLEYAYLYPPGCPFLVPGEKVTEEHRELLRNYERLGFRIEGPEKEHALWVRSIT